MSRLSRNRVGIRVGLVLMLAILTGWVLIRPSDAAKRRRPRPPKSAAAKPVDVLRYLPDDCCLLGTVNFAAIRDSRGMTQLARQNPAIGEMLATVETWIGLSPNRIERVTFAAGGRVEDAGEDENSSDHVAVLQLVQPTSAEEVLRGLQKSAPYEWRKEKAARVTLHVERSDESRAFFLPDERTVVIGSADLLRAAIRRDAPAQLPEKLASAREQLDTSQLVALAIVIKDDIDVKEIPIIPDDVLNGLEAVLVHVDAVSHVQLRIGVLCSDESVAYQIKGIFGAGWKYVRMFFDAAVEADTDNDVPEDAIKLFESLKYAVNGRTFAVQVAIPTTLLDDTDAESIHIDLTDFSNLNSIIPPVFPFGFTTGSAPPDVVFMEGEVTPIEEPSRDATSTYADGAWRVARWQYAQPAPPPSSGGFYGPYAEAQAAACTPESCGESTLQSELEDAQKKIALLTNEFQSLAAQLELAEKDRDLFQQRAELYRRLLANHLQQLDLHPEKKPSRDAASPTESPTPREAPWEATSLPQRRWDPPPAPPTAPRSQGFSSACEPASPAEATSSEAPSVGDERLPSRCASRIAAARANGPGPSGFGVPGTPGSVNKPQIAFLRPEGMNVRYDVSHMARFDSEPLVCPARCNFPNTGTYWLKLTDIPGRSGQELRPTLNIRPRRPRTESFLTHNAIPVQFTEEDFDSALQGKAVTKVMYLSDPEFQELALQGVETLVSTRLDQGVDAITEADRRGTILAVIRMDGKSLNTPVPHEVAPASHTVPEPPPSAGRTKPPDPPDIPPDLPKKIDPPAAPLPCPPIEPASCPTRQQELIFTSENLRELLDEWERMWFLDQPN